MQASHEVMSAITHCAASLHDLEALRVEVLTLRISNEFPARLAESLFQLELARLGDDEARRLLPKISDELLLFWKNPESTAAANVHPALARLWASAADMLRSFERARFRGALAACFAARHDPTELSDVIELLEPASDTRVEFARCLYYLELARQHVDSSRAQFAKRAGLLLEAFKVPALAELLVGDDEGLAALWRDVQPYLDEFLEGLEEQAEAKARAISRDSMPVGPDSNSSRATAPHDVSSLPSGSASHHPMESEIDAASQHSQATATRTSELASETKKPTSLVSSNWADELPDFVALHPVIPESLVETLPPGALTVDDVLPPEPTDVEWSKPSEVKPPHLGSSVREDRGATPGDDTSLSDTLDVDVLDDADLEEQISPETSAFWKHTVEGLGLVPKDEGRQLGLLGTGDRAQRKRMVAYLDSLEPFSALKEARAFACLLRLSLAGQTKEKSLFGGKNPRRSEALQAALRLLDTDGDIASKAAVWFELDGKNTVDALQEGLELLADYLKFCARETKNPQTQESIDSYLE
jgi:hypothetical protein